MEIVRFALSDSGATAAAGVNVTDAEVAAKIEAGNIAMTSPYGVQSVGGICVDYSGNIYVADYEEHIIVKVKEGGQVSTFAGQAGTTGNNGARTGVPWYNARFNAPRGLCCDKSGNIYVADSGNNQIRVISQDGNVSLYAGNGDGTAGMTNSSNSDPFTAQFNNPYDVAVDNSGKLYVCDRGNHAIRKIDGGDVVSLAGDGGAGNQVGLQVFGGVTPNVFNSPTSLTIDPEGNIYICDNGNYIIKKLTPRGFLYRHSGGGNIGASLGSTGSLGAGEAAFNCSYSNLMFCSYENSGRLYVVDQGNTTYRTRLLRIDYRGVPSVVVDFNEATSYDNSVIAVAVSPGQKLFVTITSVAEAQSSSSSSSSSSLDSSSSSSSESSSSSSSESSSSSS